MGIPEVVTYQLCVLNLTLHMHPMKTALQLHHTLTPMKLCQLSLLNAMLISMLIIATLMRKTKRNHRQRQYRQSVLSTNHNTVFLKSLWMSARI